MFNAERLLGQLVTNRIRGRRQKMSLGAKAGIGMGLVGVAMAAFEHFRDEQQNAGGSESAGGPPPTPGSAGAPPPLPPAQPQPVTDEAQNADSLLLIRAMIAAAAADGFVDTNERSKIVDAATKSGLTPEEIELLKSELDQPRTLDQIVADVTNDELRTQIYGVSLLAVDVDTDAERVYLDRLAVALQLDDATVQNIRAQMGG